MSLNTDAKLGLLRTIETEGRHGNVLLTALSTDYITEEDWDEMQKRFYSSPKKWEEQRVILAGLVMSAEGLDY